MVTELILPRVRSQSTSKNERRVELENYKRDRSRIEKEIWRIMDRTLAEGQNEIDSKVKNLMESQGAGFNPRDVNFLAAKLSKDKLSPALLMSFPKVNEAEMERVATRALMPPLASYVQNMHQRNLQHQKTKSLQTKVSKSDVSLDPRIVSEADKLYNSFTGLAAGEKGTINAQCMRDRYIVEKHGSPTASQASISMKIASKGTCFDKKKAAATREFSCFGGRNRDNPEYCACIGYEYADAMEQFGGQPSRDKSAFVLALKQCRHLEKR